jgi:hypothetical protein
MQKIGLVIGGGLALIILLGLFISFPTMLLWNGCLVGAIDGVREITWLQAWGLIILSGLLFKTSVSTKA